jgi:hypothetical protein
MRDCLKTIGEAARWDIEIYDAAEQFPEPAALDGICASGPN